MEKKLEVKNLRISFRTDAGKVQAVRGIDFDLYKGETLAIVGESGSGKSVTNKAIIGISAVNAIIESGEILYDGMDLLQITEDDFHKLRGDKIAMIFQDPLSALDPINRIGMQLTEAMILKNRANRRESRNLFNRTIKNLCTAMNGAMGVERNSEQGKINKQKVTDFNTFEKLHLKLEGAYNEAHTNANLAIEDIEDLLFHIEKKAVSDFGAEKSNIIREAKKSVHEHVCSDKVVALADAFKKASRGCTRAKDYAPCVEPLKALLAELKDGAAKLSPNYFALAYFLTFGKEELPKLPTDELNVYLRRYLDDNFMLAFIEDEKKGLEYPLKEHPGINVVQIIPFCHKLNQLITHNKGQDHTGNGYDHRFGKILDHGKDATVPALRRLSHFTRDLAYFGIHRIEHTRQVAFDPFREQPAQPLVQFVEYAAHKRLSPAA